jgi:radical SAM superfamily enzyme YgiQ (UPF0313 family)
MRISLIIPPSPFLGDEKRNAPLGILYIASWLEEHGHEVYVTDLRGVDPIAWGHHILRADLYGITATTPEYPYALQIAYLIKVLKGKKALTVLGGVHATAEPKNIDPIMFDKVIIGEGEGAILELILDWFDGVERRFYTSFARQGNLDSLPFPARHLVPESSIVSLTSTIAGERSTTIIGSRGCPFNCAFCASKIMWDRHVQFRSPDNIISEIKMLMIKYDVHHFRFQDDTMTLKPSWIIELCRKMKPLDITWRCTTRVDQAHFVILKEMYDAGCYEIAFGIETLEDKVLEMTNKQITTQQMVKAISDAHSVGLKTRLFFMIGLPGQDENIAENIIQFIEETHPTAVNLSTFVPMPGSDIYNNPSKYGIEIIEQDWSKYTMSKGLYGDEVNHPFIFKHDKLSDQQLRDAREKILKYFAQHNLIFNK